MIKYCLEKWNKNKHLLEDYIRSHRDEMCGCSYEDLVKPVVTYIFNDGQDKDYDNICKWDPDNITEIDDGSYQGTLLYLIPKNTYQPAEYDYLMTHVSYGSCSHCDTLYGLNDDARNANSDWNALVNDYMSLCRDLVANTIKPYNYGWREDEDFLVLEAINDD